MLEHPADWVELFREPHPLFGDSQKGDDFGYFEIPYKSNLLHVLVASGKDTGWDHVSVSLKNRCPNWEEMCHVKDAFWGPDECVIQFHPPKTDYVNFHPHVLHLWKDIKRNFPMPPRQYI